MSEMKVVDVLVYGQTLSLISDKPHEVKLLVEELESRIKSLVTQYPGAKPMNVLTLACLNILEESKKLKNVNNELTSERDKLNRTIQGFLYNID